MSKIYTRQIEYDEKTDEYIIELPDEICKELDLHPGDILTYDHQDGRIILRKRLEY
jgi:DNA-binding Xre family transcriptional regulator